MTESTTLLLAEALVKTYEQGRVRALDHLDLSISRGEFVSIMGPSGSGKSTLLHMLGALDRPDSGRVVLEGVDLSKEPRLDRIRARSIGFVFQLHNLMPTLTAVQNVELALVPQGLSRREQTQRAQQALKTVGLADRTSHRPPQLSGGQRQRVAIARALVHHPKLILADEPTGDLDQAAGQQILDQLQSLREQHDLTLVLVTHDSQVAARADRLVRLVDGRVASESD
jgi:putative ABC transport system ATP-binding protein